MATYSTGNKFCINRVATVSYGVWFCYAKTGLLVCEYYQACAMYVLGRNKKKEGIQKQLIKIKLSR